MSMVDSRLQQKYPKQRENRMIWCGETVNSCYTSDQGGTILLNNLCTLWHHSITLLDVFIKRRVTSGNILHSGNNCSWQTCINATILTIQTFCFKISSHIQGYLENSKHILPSKRLMLHFIHIDPSICFISKANGRCLKAFASASSICFIFQVFAWFYSYGTKHLLENLEYKHLLVFIHMAH